MKLCSFSYQTRSFASIRMRVELLWAVVSYGHLGIYFLGQFSFLGFKGNISTGRCYCLWPSVWNLISVKLVWLHLFRQILRSFNRNSGIWIQFITTLSWIGPNDVALSQRRMITPLLLVTCRPGCLGVSGRSSPLLKVVEVQILLWQFVLRLLLIRGTWFLSLENRACIASGAIII